MLLTDADIRALTGYRRPSAQVRALRAMGVPHRVRPDGKPVVLAEDLPTRATVRRRRDQAPDFDAL